MRDWILSGHGIGLKALWDVEDDLAADGRLVELLAPFSDSAIRLYVIYPTRSHLPNAVGALTVQQSVV